LRTSFLRAVNIVTDARVYGTDFNPGIPSRVLSDIEGSNIAIKPPETSLIADLRKKHPMFPISTQSRPNMTPVQELIYKMTQPDYISRPTADSVYYAVLGIYKLSSAQMLSHRPESFQS
jgi:hypothetical protein